MDEDVTDQTAGAPQSPAAAAGGGALIEAFPGELGAGSAIARAVAHVEIGFDGEKRKFTLALATEGNVRRSGQVDLVPLVHLGDSPSPGKGPGDARRASRHVAPISFGSRTRSHLATAKVNAQSPTRSTTSAASTLKSTCGHRCRLSRNWWFESTPLQRRDAMGRAARMAISSLTSIYGVPRCPSRTI